MGFDLNEKRFIEETGLETRLAAIIEPVANDLGYALVRVKITQENGMTLQVMAEDANGRFTIADCERLSKDLSPVLDVEDPIDREYHLEVSSPGIDRPLVRKSDFEAATGHLVRLETAMLVAGRKRFRGTIAATGQDGVTIERDQRGDDEDPVVQLPWDTIAEARLVLTDDLIREALRKDKEARRRAENDDGEAVDEDGPGQDN